MAAVEVAGGRSRNEESLLYAFALASVANWLWLLLDQEPLQIDIFDDDCSKTWRQTQEDLQRYAYFLGRQWGCARNPNFGDCFFFYTSILILRGGLTFALLSCMYSRYNVYVGLSTLKMQIDTGRSGMATTIVRVTAAAWKAVTCNLANGIYVFKLHVWTLRRSSSSGADSTIAFQICCFAVCICTFELYFYVP